MALPVPDLDDKKFEEIVREATGLIPRFASAWTDHNYSDPGITFIDLFAWLTEMQIYQLNQVTERTFHMFLKLLGLKPFTIQPARADITFDLTNAAGGFLEAGTKLTIQGKDEVVFETEEDFYLTKTLLKSVVTQLNSKKIDQSNANEKDDVYFAPFGEKALPGASLWLGFDKPFDEEEFHITFQLYETDLPDLVSKTDGHVMVSNPVTLNWEYLIEPAMSEQDVSEDDWYPLPITIDTTRNFMESGRIVFKKPDFSFRKDGGDEERYWIRCRLMEGKFEIVPLVNQILLNTVSASQIETIINESLGEGHGIPGQAVKLKKVPVYVKDDLSNVKVFVGDILNWNSFLKTLRSKGDSKEPSGVKQIWKLLNDGTKKLIKSLSEQMSPNDSQKREIVSALNNLMESGEFYDERAFADVRIPDEYGDLIKRQQKLCHADLQKLNRFLFDSAFPDQVLVSKVVIQVTHNHEWETWHQVQDFTNSAPDDRHYSLDETEGEITFGNGLNGRVPKTTERIRARLYKTSQGSEGNLPKGQQWRINKAGFNQINGENLCAAIGGKNPESIDEAKLRAQKDFNRRYRAITSKDFEELARSTPGFRVDRGKALPNYHPDFPGLKMPGAVTVVVVPYSRGKTENPGPSESFIEAVQRHLDAHRLITTEVYVIGQEYIEISVTCKISLEKKASREKVDKRVQDRLKTFLNPRKPGGPDKKGWPFGRPVFPSEILQLIDKVDGVDYVMGVSIIGKTETYCVSSRWPWRDQMVEIPRNGLVYSGVHKLEFV